MILIAVCDDNQDIIKGFPYTYLPNAKCVLNSYDIFFEELKRVTEESDEYHNYAKLIVEKFREPDLVAHHPSY